MDLEAPADAWYVWFGVVLVTLAFAGVALSIPTEPSPDTAEAANTIDSVAASSYNASGSYDHDANEVQIGLKQIALRNSGGVGRETIAFGEMLPVRVVDDADHTADGMDVLLGERPENVFEDESELEEWVDRTRDALLDNEAEWMPATGELRVKRIHMGETSVTLIDA